MKKIKIYELNFCTHTISLILTIGMNRRKSVITPTLFLYSSLMRRRIFSNQLRCNNSFSKVSVAEYVMTVLSHGKTFENVHRWSLVTFKQKNVPFIGIFKMEG